MGCTSPILGMRISPILTIGTLGRSMTGGAEGRVRGAGSASGGAVVTVVGAIGGSPNDSPTTDAAAATESPGPRSSTATITPLDRTTRIRAASTGTVGILHSRRGRRLETGASADGSTGGNWEWRSSGEGSCWPGSPGGGEIDTQRCSPRGGPDLPAKRNCNRPEHMYGFGETREAGGTRTVW